MFFSNFVVAVIVLSRRIEVMGKQNPSDIEVVSNDAVCLVANPNGKRCYFNSVCQAIQSVVPLSSHFARAGGLRNAVAKSFQKLTRDMSLLAKQGESLKQGDDQNSIITAFFSGHERQISHKTLAESSF